MLKGFPFSYWQVETTEALKFDKPFKLHLTFSMTAFQSDENSFKYYLTIFAGKKSCKTPPGLKGHCQSDLVVNALIRTDAALVSKPCLGLLQRCIDLLNCQRIYSLEFSDRDKEVIKIAEPPFLSSFSLPVKFFLSMAQKKYSYF